MAVEEVGVLVEFVVGYLVDLILMTSKGSHIDQNLVFLQSHAIINRNQRDANLANIVKILELPPPFLKILILAELVKRLKTFDLGVGIFERIECKVATNETMGSQVLHLS